MSLCGYARVLRGQSPLPRCPRHGRGPFTPCHPRRSFNYSSLPLDASVYRPCTEPTRADNYNHSRGPRSLPSYRTAAPISLSVFSRVFSLFSILKFRTFQNYLYRISSIRFLTSLQSAKIQRTMMRIKTASKQREREREIFWFSVFNQEARSGCSRNIGAIIGQV